MIMCIMLVFITPTPLNILLAGDKVFAKSLSELHVAIQPMHTDKGRRMAGKTRERLQLHRAATGPEREPV